MLQRKEPKFPDVPLDQLLAGADPRTAFDPNGLLDGLKKPPSGEPTGGSGGCGVAFGAAHLHDTCQQEATLVGYRLVAKSTERNQTPQSIASRLLGGSDGVQYHAR